MDQPSTRQEKKKNQRQKGRPDRLGSSKHIRAAEALLEKKSSSAATQGQNSSQKNKKKTFFMCLKI